MPIEIVCKRCGVPFIPDRRDIVKGPLTYRYCPACREGEERPKDNGPTNWLGRTEHAAWQLDDVACLT